MQYDHGYDNNDYSGRFSHRSKLKLVSYIPSVMIFFLFSCMPTLSVQCLISEFHFLVLLLPFVILNADSHHRIIGLHTIQVLFADTSHSMQVAAAPAPGRFWGREKMRRSPGR